MTDHFDGAFVIERAWREGLTPDPVLTVSEWSDQHRMLSSLAYSEPGRWRIRRTPYLRETMNCLSSSSPAERVVFMKGAQIGATEAGSNWIAYVIHHAPAMNRTSVTTSRWNCNRRIVQPTRIRTFSPLYEPTVF